MIFKKYYSFIAPLKKIKERNKYKISRGSIYFKSISKLNKTPTNALIPKNEFIVVVYKSTVFWALFRCPCGCNDVITLSLQKIHDPSWTVFETANGRPTVYPSIWRNQGCHSHFWIEDGKVYWAQDVFYI